MREVTVFIGTNKVGLDYIENLRDQILELFVLAKEDEKVQEAISSMNIVKEIYVKGKLVNIVVKP